LLCAWQPGYIRSGYKNPISLTKPVIMKNYRYSFKNRFLLLLAVLLFSAYQSYAQGFSPETKEKLKTIIDSFQHNPANQYIGGISVAINVDGLALWQGTSGFAARNIDAENNLVRGGTHFKKDTLSRIYSITKTFTAALTLELAKRGDFGLDEPIIKYLPLLHSVNSALDTTVTIRQLLAHESGFSDYTAEIDLQVAVAFAPTHIWNAYEMVSYVHQIAPPGTQRKYSSTNYVLLGAIIEAATGKPVEKLYRNKFFDKLGLSSMYLGGRESIGGRGNLASPHDNLSPFNPIFQATGQPTFPDAYTNISRFPLDGIVSLAFTGGGIVSNVADVAAWGNDLFGGRATSKSTLNTMLNSVADTVDEDGDKLGYGVIVTSKISDSDYFIGHDGNAPGYRSVMYYQPDRKMTIAILTNYHGANLYAVAKALYAALPNFICGNKKDYIVTCFKGFSLCLPREVASEVIKKGGYLGSCNQCAVPAVAETSKINLEAKDKLTVFPNPVTSSSVVSFQVAQTGNINLSLYDVKGKFIATLFSGDSEKGMQQQVKLDAGKLQPGIYMCRLQSVNGITTQQIILQR